MSTSSPPRPPRRPSALLARPGRGGRRAAVAAVALATLAAGAALVPSLSAEAASAQFSVGDLKVDADPAALGIDDATPTLSWRLASSERGVLQTRYRIAVATTAAKASAGKPDVWDSGVVTSRSTSVEYDGPALAPRTRYYWAVQSWAPDASGWSDAGFFETAYLDATQWQGKWISGPARPVTPVTAADGVADDAGLLPSSTLTVAAPAGATNIKVHNVAGATVGSSIVVGLGAAAQTVQLTAVGTASSTTTTVAPAAAGDTRLHVASTAGLTAGTQVLIGTQQVTVTAVGTAAGAARTLAAAAAAGDTTIRVNNVGGFTVGDKVVIGSGANPVVRTVTAIGTAGATGTGITLDAALGTALASGSPARGLGTGLTTGALGAAVPSAAVVLSPGTGLTLATPLTNAVPVGGQVRNPAATDICRQTGNSANAGSCKPIRPNYLMRKSFQVAPASQHGKVASARLYSTGLGWSQPTINGELTQPDDHLNPGFTDYDDTVQYTTDDVTDLIDQGASAATPNVVAAEIAAGRYDSESVPSNHRFETAQWRALETLKADLVITYADGTEQVVASDDTWKVSTDGATRYADFDDGEIYDARHDLGAWDTAAYDASGWGAAAINPGPSGQLVAQIHERTSKVADLEGPFRSWQPADGVTAFDVGRQITGWGTIEVWGAQPGQVIRTSYVERRNDDTSIDDPAVPGTGQDGALQFAGQLQQDYYVSDGTGTKEDPEVFTPNWNFAGFQWIQVDGGAYGGTSGFSAQPGTAVPLPGNVHVDVASVQQIRTDQPKVGTFETDVPLLDKIYDNVERSVEGDWIAGYSMDTPTYEKDGWTGDAQIILPTVANIFDIQRSMQKSARDSRDSQIANGQVGLLIPGSEGYGYCSPSSPATPDQYVPCGNAPSLNVFKAAGGGATPIWDAFIFVTSTEAYLRYADLEPYETAYGTMTRYLDDNLQGGKPYSQGPGGWFLWDGNLQDGKPDWTLNSGLGDWAFVTGADGNAAEGTDLNVGGFQAASSTAFTAYLASQTADAARLLYAKTGDAQYLRDAGRYDTLFDNIRADFNKRWWDPVRGFYAENSTQELRQGFQAWAIGFGLVEPEDERALMEKLAYDVAVTRTGHAMIGFVGIRWIWPVLSEAAHLGVPHAREALFKVAQQTTYPSYGYHVGLGYTGVGEYWEASTRTRNHQFQGSIGQWFYEELAGIKPAAPGYSEITVRPLVGGQHGVHDVAASYDSVHGMVRSAWHDADGKVTMKVTIPANTTAKIYVPGDATDTITESGSGRTVAAASAPGVTLVGPEDDAMVYQVGSGSYEFTVTADGTTPPTGPSTGPTPSPTASPTTAPTSPAQVATTTTLTASGRTMVTRSGKRLRLTARVAPATAVAGTTVSFYIGKRVYKTKTLDSGGSASFRLPRAAAPGTYTIRAVYAGTATSTGSVSTKVRVKVVRR